MGWRNAGSGRHEPERPDVARHGCQFHHRYSACGGKIHADRRWHPALRGNARRSGAIHPPLDHGLQHPAGNPSRLRSFGIRLLGRRARSGALHQRRRWRSEEFGRKEIMNRRKFLQHGTAAAGVFAGGLSRSLGAESKPGTTVETSAGKIRGLVIDKVNAFKGIPYGASTAGDRRFMPPVKPAAWTGVKDTFEWGP